MKRRGAVLVAVLSVACALASGSRPATAAPRDLLDYLDGDAPVLTRVDLETWEQAVQLYRTSGLPGATKTVFLASAAASAVIGFDPLVRAGWYRAGIDADVPVVASFGALDQPGTRGTRFWRARVVMAVDDARKLDASVARVAGVVPGMTPVAPGNAAAVAAAAGAAKGSGPQVVAALRAAGVQAVGRLPLLGTLIAIHRMGRGSGGALVVDLLTPANGTSLSWSRDGRAVLARLARVPRVVRARIKHGAAARLTGPGAVVWADATGLYDLHRQLQHELYLRLTGRGVPAGDPDNEAEICAGFRDIVTGGPFTDIAAAVDIRPGRGSAGASIHTDVVYGLRGAFKLARSMIVADDQLLDAKGMTSAGAVVAGELFLKSLAPLRALPRPKVLKLERQELRWTLLNCSPPAWTALALFGWPQALGMVLDEVAKIHPQAATLVAGTRNTAFAFRQLGDSVAHMRGFVELSMTSKAAAYPPQYFAAVWGRKQSAKRREQVVNTWGNGPLRPYHLPIAGHDVFGVAFTPRAVSWRIDHLLTAPRSLDRLVAEIYVAPAHLIQQLAPTSGWAAALAPIANRLLGASLHTQFGADTLESVIVLDVR